MFNNILFVCTANICRSPAVEALFRAKLKTEKVLMSAGTKAKENQEPDPVMTELLLDRGINMAQNTSKKVTRELLNKADLVLVMEQRHAKEIAQINPTVMGKVKLLGHWNGNREVPDPFNKDLEAYRFVTSLIEDCAQSWIKVLEQ